MFFFKEYTVPIITDCIKCGQKFRTYIPNTDCKLPDGTIQCHQQPQDECPDCDFTVLGSILNEDLFPGLNN